MSQGSFIHNKTAPIGMSGVRMVRKESERKEDEEGGEREEDEERERRYCIALFVCWYKGIVNGTQ